MPITPVPEHQPYEYEVVPRAMVPCRRNHPTMEELKEFLNEWGSQGWRLCSADLDQFIFMRKAGE